MMTTVTAEEFHQRIHDHHMYGLWELASQMTVHPMPEMRAWMWKWWLLDSIIKQSGEVIPVGEERRALQHCGEIELPAGGTKRFVAGREGSVFRCRVRSRCGAFVRGSGSSCA